MNRRKQLVETISHYIYRTLILEATAPVLTQGEFNDLKVNDILVHSDTGSPVLRIDRRLKREDGTLKVQGTLLQSKKFTDSTKTEIKGEKGKQYIFTFEMLSKAKLGKQTVDNIKQTSVMTGEDFESLTARVRALGNSPDDFTAEETFALMDEYEKEMLDKDINQTSKDSITTALTSIKQGGDCRYKSLRDKKQAFVNYYFNALLKREKMGVGPKKKK